MRVKGRFVGSLARIDEGRREREKRVGVRVRAVIFIV